MPSKLQQAIDLSNKKELYEAFPLFEEAVNANHQDSGACLTLTQIQWLHNHDAKKAYNAFIEDFRSDAKSIWAQC